MTTQSTRPTSRSQLWTLGLVMVILVAPAAWAGEISIDVAPNTLNLNSHGKVVTVHTDVAYSAIDVYTVYLNEVSIQSWKADNRGNFVAKFKMDDVKTIDGLVLNDYNTLKFVAMTTYDEAVWGTAEVMVIDRGYMPSGNRQDPIDE